MSSASELARAHIDRLRAAGQSPRDIMGLLTNWHPEVPDVRSAGLAILQDKDLQFRIEFAAYASMYATNNVLYTEQSDNFEKRCFEIVTKLRLGGVTKTQFREQLFLQSRKLVSEILTLEVGANQTSELMIQMYTVMLTSTNERVE